MNKKPPSGTLWDKPSSQKLNKKGSAKAGAAKSTKAKAVKTVTPSKKVAPSTKPVKKTIRVNQKRKPQLLPGLWTRLHARLSPMSPLHNLWPRLRHPSRTMLVGMVFGCAVIVVAISTSVYLYTTIIYPQRNHNILGAADGAAEQAIVDAEGNNTGLTAIEYDGSVWRFTARTKIPNAAPNTTYHAWLRNTGTGDEKYAGELFPGPDNMFITTFTTQSDPSTIGRYDLLQVATTASATGLGPTTILLEGNIDTLDAFQVPIEE